MVQRNFNPTNYEYSSYVNGTLYDYAIVEGCTTTPIVALAVPFIVNPNDFTFTAWWLREWTASGHAQDFPGQYYTGLTRDDLGGLRYLMATNRINVETVVPGVQQLVTNPVPQILVTSNLALFYAQTLTNSPAALTAIYTNLIITSTNFAFSNVVTTNVTAVLSQPPAAPAGSIAITLVTNFTTNVQPIFFYTFGNLVIYTNFPQSFVTTQTTSIGAKPPAPAGTLADKYHQQHHAGQYHQRVFLYPGLKFMRQLRLHHPAVDQRHCHHQSDPHQQPVRADQYQFPECEHRHLFHQLHPDRQSRPMRHQQRPLAGV